MEQKLGRGIETVAKDAPVHPGIKLLEAIDDSHNRRDVQTDIDQKLQIKIETELARQEIGDGTINGYSRDLQIAWANMLEKDAWRS